MSGPELERDEVVSRLMQARGDALLITGLGSPGWDAAASDHRPENFYLWGGMGCAVMTGLGCALARPDRKVWVLTGDGDALMGIGSLATVAVQRPENLAIIVLDNEHYGETGMQPTHTFHGTDLAAMAAGAGIPATASVTDDDGVSGLIDMLAGGRMPLFAAVKVRAGKPKPVLPPRDGSYLKTRFRQAVLGPTEAVQPR